MVQGKRLNELAAESRARGLEEHELQIKKVLEQPGDTGATPALAHMLLCPAANPEGSHLDQASTAHLLLI